MSEVRPILRKKLILCNFKLISSDPKRNILGRYSEIAGSDSI